MRSLLVVTAVVLIVYTSMASGATQAPHVIHYHPITPAEYEAILGLTEGKPVISEARLITSGVAAIKGLAAGLTTGLAAGFLPSILASLGITHTNSTKDVVDFKDGYPLCMIKTDDIDEADANLRQNGDGEILEYGPHDPDAGVHRRKLPIVNCIVVVKRTEDEYSTSTTTTTTTTTKAPTTTPRPHHTTPSYPWQPHPYPHPRPPHGGSGFPWWRCYPYYPYYPCPPYGLYRTSEYSDDSLYSRYSEYPNYPSAPEPQRDEAATDPWHQQMNYQMHATNSNHNTMQQPNTIAHNTSKTKKKKRVPHPAYEPQSDYHQSSEYHQPQSDYSETPTTKRSKTKAKRDKIQSYPQSYPQISSYPESSYQPAVFPQFNYQSNYPKVSYTHALNYPAPVYVMTTPKPKATTTRRTRRIYDSEELENSGEYIRVRHN